MLKTICLCVAAASALLHTPRRPQHRRISLQSLATDAEISLLAGDEYAMDISSITPDSERETYIGQGSGVNEGTGIGALGNRLKAWVGRLLARKNKPIYDELWTIIHDDLLAACEARAGVRPAPTWFSSDKAPHAFATDDGACTGEVAAYSGGPIDWVTTCKFFSSTLGFGNMRIDGWLDRSSRAPHLAVHLCIVFNVLFIYVTLVPRTNLVLDDAYNDFIYGDPKASLGDRSLNDIHNDCIDARDFKAYHSKSHVVKAFMTAPTTLLYTVKHNKKNFELIREISKNYTNYWLDLALGEVDDPGGVLSKGVTTDVVQRELLQTDVRTRQFCGRDPDTKNVANIFGLELTDKLVRTLWGSPEDPVWASR